VIEITDRLVCVNTQKQRDSFSQFNVFQKQLSLAIHTRSNEILLLSAPHGATGLDMPPAATNHVG
jgi:hypothetical protein